MYARFTKFQLQPESLAHVEIFESLDADQRQEVLKYCEGRRYPAKRNIIEREESGHDVFFLINGRV